MSYVVVAELRAREGLEEAFGAFLDAHARASREQEPGCRVFDVCQDPDDPALYLTYEVYADGAAYGAHRESAHYHHFRERAPELLADDGRRMFVSRRVLQRRE